MFSLERQEQLLIVDSTITLLCNDIVYTLVSDMERKIFKAGNSLVISLPRESLQSLGLEEGSEVNVALDKSKGRIVIEPSRPALADIDPAFAQQLDDFIEQYRPALEALAK